MINKRHKQRVRDRYNKKYAFTGITIQLALFIKLVNKANKNIKTVKVSNCVKESEIES